MILLPAKETVKALFMVWNARLPIESEFGESVRVVRCQRLLMFEHVERLDGGLNDAPGICPPPVCQLSATMAERTTHERITTLKRGVI